VTAFFGQSFANGPAQALCAASDDGDFVFELSVHNLARFSLMLIIEKNGNSVSSDRGRGTEDPKHPSSISGPRSFFSTVSVSPN
jgi:hypothetical protein